MLDQPLVYTQSNGTVELRSLIAGLYPGATPNTIEVTNGGSEANYLSVWRLVEPGDEVVLLVPNYMQTWGLARAFGGTSSASGRSIEDAAAGRWRPDLDALQALVTDRTRLIIICTPNNPTGATSPLRSSTRSRRSPRATARGCCRTRSIAAPSSSDEETPSMWGRYERVIVTSGLSKAYGLPGLRIGWIVGPPSVCRLDLVVPRLHDDRARRAERSPGARGARAQRGGVAILARTRRIVRENLPLIERWLREHDPMFSWIPPQRRRHRLRPLQLRRSTRRSW